MGKFYGLVGYADTIETSPGVWEEVITERPYYGDVLKLSRRTQNTEQLNDDILISQDISILADPYAIEHFYHIRYIRWMGTAWTVNKIEVARPRLILSLGGLYNEQTL